MKAKKLLALDLQNLAYRNKVEIDIPSIRELSKLSLGERLKAVLELKDEAGEFLRGHLIPILRYANYLKNEISHNVRDFDRVMKWGFGWEMGPFEMIDAIGHEKLDIGGPKSFYLESKVLDAKSEYVSVAAEPQYAQLSSFPIVKQAESYVLRDMGDGVTALSLTTKMGTISTLAIAEMTELLSGPLDRFVFTSEARSFSAGFDLSFFAKAIDAVNYELIDAELIRLQRLAEMFERKRCVAAVFGHCLGAGFELALGCATIAAHPETNIGFPEARVGLIPGGRGTTLMRLYNQHSARRLAEVSVNLMNGTVATNPDQAHSLGYLRPTDVTIYHPDRLFTDAKKLVMTAQPWTRPAFQKPEGPLTGMIDRAQDEAMKPNGLSDYDRQIGEAVKAVFAKTTGYDNALELERKEFLSLCTKALTHARIRHMLENGKPLRN